MVRLTHTLLILISLNLLINAQDADPDFTSIYKREIPSWFNQDKFGIFVVWGPYSVPSYKTKGYAEWYWKDSGENDPESREFHQRVYGKDFNYEQFAGQFKAELWDPDFWCRLFAESGAKYVATTANYHDGFAMWPTQYGMTENTKQWNSAVVGPKRDILGELNTAGKKYGLKMGIYYSLYEWYNPLWLTDREKYVTDWLHPKFKEVVTKYKPWFIFLDWEWEQDYKAWKSEELAWWLYNESPVKNNVVVNDRWGQCRGVWGDVYESEYGGGKYTSPNHPWQEDRGIGHSYGYNRMESIYDYDSREELIRMFSSVVGGGGNFLLCVGPTGDGRIPVIMQERLLQIGEWLEINGDAIYGSTANPFWPRKFGWGTVSAKPGKLFIHVHDPDLEKIHIRGMKADIKNSVLLHKKGAQPVSVQSRNNELILDWPRSLNNDAVTIIELDVKEGYEVDNTPRQYADGTVEFNCRAMAIHGNNAYLHYEGAGNGLMILNWTDPNEYLSTDFVIDKPGKFELTLIYCATKVENEDQLQGEVNTEVGGKFLLKIGDTEIKAKIKDTGSSFHPARIKAGFVEIEKSGKYEFSITPVDDGNWNGFRFQGVEMKLVIPQLSHRQAL